MVLDLLWVFQVPQVILLWNKGWEPGLAICFAYKVVMFGMLSICNLCSQYLQIEFSFKCLNFGFIWIYRMWNMDNLESLNFGVLMGRGQKLESKRDYQHYHKRRTLSFLDVYKLLSTGIRMWPAGLGQHFPARHFLWLSSWVLNGWVLGGPDV